MMIAFIKVTEAVLRTGPIPTASALIGESI